MKMTNVRSKVGKTVEKIRFFSFDVMAFSVGPVLVTCTAGFWLSRDARRDTEKASR